MRPRTSRVSGSRKAALLALALAVAGSPSVRAGDLLGLYVGAGVGESTVRSDDDFGPGLPGDFRDHHTAWQVAIGVRPIPVLGAEFDYVDFGHATNAQPYAFGSAVYGVTGVSTHPRASALFVVGYLPQPLPLLDLYAKAGLARLDTTVDGTLTGTCPAGVTCPACTANCLAAPLHESLWSTNFAYGAGVQMRLLGLAFRAEYQRISSTYGDPDVFSLSVLWTF